MNNSTAEKKLDKWAELLLDTGKRNNLINFKDSKASSVEVLIPSAEELFEQIDNSVNFEVFDPKITDDDLEEKLDKEHSFSEKTETKKDKSSYMDKYSGKLKKKIRFYFIITLRTQLRFLRISIKELDRLLRKLA